MTNCHNDWIHPILLLWTQVEDVLLNFGSRPSDLCIVLWLACPGCVVRAGRGRNLSLQSAVRNVTSFLMLPKRILSGLFFSSRGGANSTVWRKWSKLQFWRLFWEALKMGECDVCSECLGNWIQKMCYTLDVFGGDTWHHTRHNSTAQGLFQILERQFPDWVFQCIQRLLLM